MKKVKFTFGYDWPILNQTPGGLGIWDDFHFILNGDDKQEYDFWVVFDDYKFETQVTRCPKENIIFIVGEPYSIKRYDEEFLKQFSLFITVQKELSHLPNAIYTHSVLPWHVKSKSYDDLISMSPVKKTKGISIITSNKAMNDGHKRRLEFAFRVKEYFGDQIDLFGRGIREFDDKWEVLAPYKYSIAIENDFLDHWVTEKFYDCILAYTFPFYYGCPNLEDYVGEGAFERIDISCEDNSIRRIEKVLRDENYYQEHLGHLIRARSVYLSRMQFFPFMVDIMKKCPGTKMAKNRVKKVADLTPCREGIFVGLRPKICGYVRRITSKLLGT